MGIQTMKVHQFTRGGLIWEHNELSSLSLTCKRLRPLAPKLPTTTTSTTNGTFDLKSFIRAENGPKKARFFDYEKKESISQVEAQPGGTRWNPTPEQIGMLEMLYKNGMRTPNAQKIEHVTAQLAKYGKIEGKNVFYWFQNHKARERQKQKRNDISKSHISSKTLSSPFSSTTISLVLSSSNTGDEVEEEGTPFKRKCRTWEFDQFVEENNRHFCTKKEPEDRTLKLFPLHPESGRS